MNQIKLTPAILVMLTLLVCQTAAQDAMVLKQAMVIPGAGRHDQYLDLVRGKRLGIVANQASLAGERHLVDLMVEKDMQVVRVFAPEHGFRGEAEAGAKIIDGLDEKTGLPVISLYGKNFKPASHLIRDLDMVLFDLQDVGVRFYTYISTLHYVMEACAEEGVPMILLDRPNPNGFYVDGPVLESEYRSFVGMHPVPVVYGMTIGEYGLMINGEKWLKNGITCELTVIPCANYDHQTEYELPVKPSPNLQNANSVFLYPSICFFEGTVASLGRGTPWPFEVWGHPEFTGDFSFRPEPIKGVSENPPLKGELCKGVDLRGQGKALILNEPRLHLEWLIQAFVMYGSKPGFFTSYFDKLAGTAMVREGILAGKPASEIALLWDEDVRCFLSVRGKYLIYP